MRQRLLEFDYDELNSLDYDSQLVCLSGKSYAFLLSLVPFFKVSMHWGNKYVEGRDLVENLIGELLMSSCLQFRQTDCTLEYSYDGENWLPMFDFGSCITNGVNPLLDNLRNDLLDELRDAYNGDPANIAPNLIYGPDGNNHLRDLAICNALVTIFGAMQTVEQERRNNQSANAWEWSGLFDSILGIALAVGVAAATPLAIALAAGAALANAFAVAIETWQSVADQVLNNSDYAKTLACCAYDNLQGSTPTYSAWLAAIQPGGCGVSGDILGLLAAFNDTMDDLDVYISFLDYAEKMYNLVSQGLLDACACDDSWTQTFDFLISDEGFSYLGTTQYTLGVGFTNTPSGDVDRLDIRIDTDPFYITNIEWYYDGPITHDPTTGQHALLQYDGSGAFALPRTIPIGDADVNQWFDALYYRYNPSTGGDPINQLPNLYKLVIHGEGYNPFA